MLDAFPHTGEMLMAMLLFKQELNADVRVHTFAPNEVEKDWLQESIHDWLVQRFLEGKIKVRDAQPLSAEVARAALALS